MLKAISGFPGGSAINNRPAVQEPQKMQVRALGQEDHLEKGILNPNYKLQQVKGCNTPHHDSLWMWLLAQGRHQSDLSLNLLSFVVFPVFKPKENREKASLDFHCHEPWVP